MTLIILDIHFVATVLFILGGLSDWLDGFLARKLKQTTRFGAFLDPVADKLLVISVSILLVWDIDSIWFTIPAVIITCREVSIVALREWMATIGSSSKVKVGMYSKIKSLLQFISISLFVLISDLDVYYPFLLAYIFLYIATYMTLVSMIRYLFASWSLLDWRGKKT